MTKEQLKAAPSLCIAWFGRWFDAYARAPFVMPKCFIVDEFSVLVSANQDLFLLVCTLQKLESIPLIRFDSNPVSQIKYCREIR